MMENIEKIDKNVLEVIEKFYSLDGVRAVGMDGSRASENNDLFSDYDFCVFTDKEPSVADRKKIILPVSSKYDLGLDFFGPGDEFFVDKAKAQLDVAFFDIKWMEETVENVWHKFQASNGYTTCFLYTLKHARILYDPSSWFANIKKLLDTEYPEKLREIIIERSFLLMKNKNFSSYYEQIDKAIRRKDFVSLNHRLAAFFASYFDALFAINRLLNPGEKKLVNLALKNCKILPVDFETDFSKVFTLFDEKVLNLLSDMVEKLSACIDLKK